MKLTPENCRYVTLDWEDITASDDWSGEDPDPHCDQMLTAGWIIRETKNYLWLARTWSVDEETWHDVWTFPKRPVVGITDYVKKP